MTVTSPTNGLLISKMGQFNRLSTKAIEQELAAIGISYQEMRIAGLLMGESGITQKDLAEKLSVRPATLSQAITKLEKQGLIERRVSSADKRVQFLKLKPNKNIAKVDALLNRLEDALCEGIGQKDLATTRKVLQLLIDNLNKTINS